MPRTNVSFDACAASSPVARVALSASSAAVVNAPVLVGQNISGILTAGDVATRLNDSVSVHDDEQERRAHGVWASAVFGKNASSSGRPSVRPPNPVRNGVGAVASGRSVVGSVGIESWQSHAERGVRHHGKNELLHAESARSRHGSKVIDHGALRRIEPAAVQVAHPVRARNKRATAGLPR